MRRSLALSAAALLLGSPASAATPVDSVAASPDVTVELGTTNQVTEDQDVAVDNLVGMVMLANVGSLPSASDLSGYELLESGDQLLCFDTTVDLPGGLVAGPGDVVRYDGVAYKPEFDASANGVPAGAYCDAVAVDPSGDLVLSFDVTTLLPGPLTANDEDLVRVTGASSYTLLFDGDAIGIPPEADVDGAQLLAVGNLAVSLDVTASVGGVTADDEDVLEYVPSSGFWSISYDGSAQDADWAAADLDALTLNQPACVGDTTGDGITGTPDFVLLSANFGQMVTPGTNGDVNGDGLVGIPDLTILSGDFGCTP